MAENAPAPTVDPQVEEQRKFNQAMLDGLKQVAAMVAQQRQPAPQPVAAPAAPQPPAPLDVQRYQEANADYMARLLKDPIGTQAQSVNLAVQTAEQRAQLIVDEKIGNFQREQQIREQTSGFFQANPDLQDRAVEKMMVGFLNDPSYVNPQASHLEKLQHAANLTRQYFGQRDQYMTQQASAYAQQQLAAAGIGGVSAPPVSIDDDEGPQDEMSLRRAIVEDMKKQKQEKRDNPPPMFRKPIRAAR